MPPLPKLKKRFSLKLKGVQVAVMHAPIAQPLDKVQPHARQSAGGCDACLHRPGELPRRDLGPGLAGPVIPLQAAW